MAKRISDEEMRLSIIIDGNEAQKELLDLEKSTRNLNRENKDLREEKRRLERQNKKDTEEYRNVTAAIRENNRVIKENASGMKTLQEAVGLTGLTLSQLKNKASELKRQLSHMIPGSADYIRIEQDINAVNGRLSELKNKTDQAGSSLNNMSTDGKRFITFLAGVIVAITGVVVSFQKFIDLSGQLSDAQSDVQKTTGMTKKEVDELTKSLGLMKTRTARTELLKLAEEGGRLGITGVKDIQAYLTVANQLKTALGDDLSNAQITEVGKMTEQYKIAAETGRDFGGSMLSLGSAINEVSQAGSNQAGFLVDYLKRTVGVSTQINMSAADNIGFAATFDEIGQSAEVSGTMMNKVMMDMSKNTGIYAKIAKMSVKDFSDLLAKDANEAMIKFLEGLKGSNEGFQSMILKMDELDEGGARGAQALSALSNNVDKLRARQKTANEALLEATSLTNEYNIKNENLAALYEKIRNTIESWMTADVLVEWLYTTVEWFAKLIGATEDTDGKVTKFRDGLVLLAKVFAVVFAAMVTNVAWQKLVFLWTNRNTESTLLYNIAQKAKAVAISASTISTHAYTLALALAQGNIVAATAALRGMMAALIATPWGAILTAIAAVSTAYLLFKSRNNELKVEIDSLSNSTDTLAKREAELAKTYAKSSSELKSKVEPLIRVLKDKNTQLETRKKAYAELIKISPDFLDTVDKEYIATSKLDTVYGNLLIKLKQKLRAQANANVMQSVYEDESKALLEVVKIEANLAKIRQQRIDSDNKAKDLTGDARQKQREKSTDIEVAWNREYSKLLDARQVLEDKANIRSSADEWKDKEVKRLENKLKELKKGTEDYLAVESELSSLIGIINEEKTNTPTTPTGGTPDKKYENEKKQRIEKLKEYQKERLAIEREIEDSILDQLDDNFNKERQKLDTEYTRKLEDLENKKISESEIALSLQRSKNTKLSAEERNFYAQQAGHWKKQNDFLQGLQDSADQTFLLKKKALVNKYSKNTADELNKEFEQAKVQRETAFNQELVEIGNNAKHREQAEKEFQKQEREEQKKHLEALLKLYTDMLAGANFDGIDYSLLTPEAREKLEEDVAKVQLAVEKLNAAKAGEKSDDDELSLGLGGQVDILGFSPDQWEGFFENIERGTIGVETMTMAVQALQNMWSQYDQLVTAGENRRIKQYEKNTNERQRRLKRQLDVGIIDQDQYNQANQTLEADLDRKKAEIEYKQAKRKRTMDVANVLTNTALAIMNIWAQASPWAAPFLTGMVSAIGGVQLATIMSQPLPSMQGFEDGLYGDYIKREQDGKVFKAGFGGNTKSGIVSKPTYYMAGENGPEMIIDNKAFRQMDPNLRESLVREIRTIKGYESGYYPNYIQDNNTNSPNPNSNDALIPLLLRLNEILNKLESNGVIAHVSNKNMPDMKRLKEGIDKYNSIKENSKIG